MKIQAHYPMQIKTLSILPIIALAPLAYLLAQPTGLPTEKVEVVKSFNARLADAEKINSGPASLPVDTTLQLRPYQVDAEPLALTYEAPKLRPLALRREKQPELYKGYLLGGYGNLNSPYVAGGYTFRNENKDFDAHLGVLHHSARNTKLEFQRFARTEAELQARYALPVGVSLKGEAGFRQIAVGYYGYDHDSLDFTPEQGNQAFNRLNLGLELRNSRGNDLGLDFLASGRFYSLWDKFDSRENGLDLKASATKWFADSHPLRLEAGYDLSAFRDTTGKRLSNLFVNPSFTFHGEIFRIRAGANLVTGSGGTQILPDLEGLISLAGNALGVYAGWKGAHLQQNFQLLSDYNPFMVTRFQPRTTFWNDIHAGVKGAAAGWNYQAQVGFKRVGDLALFLPDSLDTRKFDILYDTARIVYVSANAEVELWPGFELQGNLVQNFFDLNGNEKAWHLPGLEANVGARYHLLDEKLVVKADAWSATGVHTLGSDGEAKRLGGLFDLSIGARYQILEKLGVWIQANNITHNRRERWERYPSFGFNILGGVLVRF